MSRPGNSQKLERSTASQGGETAPFHYVNNGDVRLAVYRWGEPSEKRPVILLVHGYPDNALVWAQLAQQLAKDFLVYAYDVRGAGLSSTPRAGDAYRLEHLSNDFQCVIDALSPDQPVHLVAHDWGSIQSWESVCKPELSHRIASFTTLSGPCLDHAGHWLRRRITSRSLKDKRKLFKQLAHSWYVFGFHLPLLGPGLWTLGGEKLWPQFLKHIEGISGAHISASQVADGRNGIKLYRANFLDRILKPRQRRTTVPVQLLVARNDHFMIEEISDDLPLWAATVQRKDLDVGHWSILSNAECIAQNVRDFVFACGFETEPARKGANPQAALA